jgi:hypothetical protein
MLSNGVSGNIMKVKLVIQVILLLWFVVINVAILVPSYQILFCSEDTITEGVQPAPHPPGPPPAPAAIGPLDPSLDLEKQKQQVEAYKQQVSAYAEQVKAYTQEMTAYTQQVTAYKIQEGARTKAGRTGNYELVVKNSLITLLGGFATTLIAYVFANLGAGVANNYVRVRKGLNPEPLSLL